MSEIVYLDVCCLKRPFDDQRSTRVQMETTAITAVVARAERGTLRLVRDPRRRDHEPDATGRNPPGR